MQEERKFPPVENDFDHEEISKDSILTDKLVEQLENVLVSVDLSVTQPVHLEKMVKGEIVKSLYVSTEAEEEENDWFYFRLINLNYFVC